MNFRRLPPRDWGQDGSAAVTASVQHVLEDLAHSEAREVDRRRVGREDTKPPSFMNDREHITFKTRNGRH